MGLVQWNKMAPEDAIAFIDAYSGGMNFKDSLSFSYLASLGNGGIDTEGTGKVMNPSEAASKITNAERTGTALTKSDIFHRSASYVPESQLAGGKTFNITGGDGILRTLLQVGGELNGKVGIFEYIIEANGTVSHQLFKTGGIINGIPN